MPPGGTLVINTHYPPDYMIRFVPGPERLAQLVCVDAAKLAEHKWLYYRLGELGLDRLSTEGAAERSKAVAPDIAAPLIAAVVKTTGIVKIATIEPMIAKPSAPSTWSPTTTWVPSGDHPCPPLGGQRQAHEGPTFDRHDPLVRGNRC